MISAKLARVRITKDGMIQPILLDPKREDHQELVRDLGDFVHDMIGRRRSEVETGLDELVKALGRKKEARGMAELVLQWCEFEQPGGLDPGLVRERLFALGTEHFPVGSGGVDRSGLVAQVAEELEATPADVEAAMFGDLKGEQRLVRVEAPEPEERIFRYNVALNQAVLLRARWLEVALERPEAARVRQLVNYLRFFELLYEVSGDDDTIIFKIDGPASVLKGSRRYGLQMARFFPALLLQERFKAVAGVKWPGRRGEKLLSLGPHKRLRTWYRDVGGWTHSDVQGVIERLESHAAEGETIEPAHTVHMLGGQKLFVPDLQVSGPGREPLLVELLWPHRQGDLVDYLARYLEHRPLNAMLCLIRPGRRNKRKCIEAEKVGGGAILFCSRSVPAVPILERFRAGNRSSQLV